MPYVCEWYELASLCIFIDLDNMNPLTQQVINTQIQHGLVL